MTTSFGRKWKTQQPHERAALMASGSSIKLEPLCTGYKPYRAQQLLLRNQVLTTPYESEGEWVTLVSVQLFLSLSGLPDCPAWFVIFT